MKRRLFVVCTSLLLLVGLYVTSTTAVNAAAVSPKQNISHITAQQLANGISLLKTHIHFNAHRIASLDVSNASSIGLDEQTFVLFEQGVQQYNAYLSKGLIKTSHISARVQSTITSPNIHADCAGLSGFGYSNGSWALYIDECQTVKIEASLAIAAGIVGIAGILVEFIPVIGQVAGAALGIASFLIAIGAGALLFTDASGGFNGLYITGRYFRNGIAVDAYGAQ